MEERSERRKGTEKGPVLACKGEGEGEGGGARVCGSIDRRTCSSFAKDKRRETCTGRTPCQQNEVNRW